jgi:hypothetical protein
MLVFASDTTHKEHGADHVIFDSLWSRASKHGAREGIKTLAGPTCNDDADDDTTRLVC